MDSAAGNTEPHRSKGRQAAHPDSADENSAQGVHKRVPVATKRANGAKYLERAELAPGAARFCDNVVGKGATCGKLGQNGCD